MSPILTLRCNLSTSWSQAARINGWEWDDEDEILAPAGCGPAAGRRLEIGRPWDYLDARSRRAAPVRHQLFAVRRGPRLGGGIDPGRRDRQHRRGRAYVPRLLRPEPDLGEYLA